MRENGKPRFIARRSGFCVAPRPKIWIPYGARTDIGVLAVCGQTTVDLERRIVLSSAP